MTDQGFISIIQNNRGSRISLGRDGKKGGIFGFHCYSVTGNGTAPFVVYMMIS